MKKRTWFFLCMALLACLSLWGCGNDETQEDSSGYSIYYTNIEGTKVVAVSYTPESKTDEDLINELLVQLDTVSEESDTRLAKPDDVTLEKAQLNENTLVLQFSEEYLEIDRIQEILLRMAYVRTLVQVPGVDTVEFYVGDAPLSDDQGNAIGPMSAEDFIDNTDSEMDAYDVSTVTLYFADQDGESLIAYSEELVLGISVSTEKVIVENLIKGPGEDTRGIYATVPEETRLLGISTDDGVCYVNLSEEFLEPLPDVTQLVSLYSIVNSLCELSTVDKVQISINGSTEVNYIENITFSMLFETNTELIAE